MKNEHPYSAFEKDPLWNIVKKAINDLEKNQDIKLRTPKKYVVGYLTKVVRNKIGMLESKA